MDRRNDAARRYDHVGGEKTLDEARAVGYQEIHPLSQQGRLFASILILTGVTVILVSIGVLGSNDIAKHGRRYYRRERTSSLGNARFTGVPPGRVIVRVKTPTDSTEQRAIEGRSAARSLVAERQSVRFEL